MSSITVPQVEYVGGKTPQESAALFNARIIELRFNNPTFERDGSGFWITYSKDIQHESPKEIACGRDTFLCCDGCAYFERVSERVKWGMCSFHQASVGVNKKICEEYRKRIGGDELDA